MQNNMIQDHANTLKKHLLIYVLENKLFNAFRKQLRSNFFIYDFINYRKFPKYSDIQNMFLITLQFAQCDSTIE